MSSLTWDDLFVDAAHLDFDRLLLEWSGMVVGQIRPIGASVFGDLFFQRGSGEVEKLDVLEGGIHPVAASFEQFTSLMNSVEWQEKNLMSNGVALLKDKGVTRATGQFFGFVPHPAFTGAIDWARVMPLNAAVWNSICAQALSGKSVPREPAKRPWWKLGKA